MNRLRGSGAAVPEKKGGLPKIMVKMSDYANHSPQDVRRMIREGRWDRPTSGMCAGHVQANLVALPKDLAYDFLVFAQRNPKPCPILDVTEKKYMDRRYGIAENGKEI